LWKQKTKQDVDKFTEKVQLKFEKIQAERNFENFSKAALKYCKSQVEKAA
jgi:hypothetical protein